jgi:ADP-ribosylglycohydrolase
LFIARIMAIPEDYLERIYAGVLGKCIGVYLGRPFELWSHQRILRELGEIHYYVHEKTGDPLVVVDDDISGTFTFVRALEEHGAAPDLSSENIGKTWLNNVIQNRSIFWWGGNGVSTEHTAYLNLKKGIPAPISGSMELNGRVISEQIGAQIFIDGWAMVSPGNPSQAAKLAEQAARVSHDGVAVHSAKFLASMEAEAFISKDINHLLDTGLKFVPEDSGVVAVVRDVRMWQKTDGDWYKTRERTEEKYGMAKYPGVCHVIPNLALIILALVYGSHSFHETMTIINTAGEDTDCNGGNVGCLVALMHGMNACEDGPDWRGPLADRALVSGSDGGSAINNAARLAYAITNMGRRINGLDPLAPPKRGAQFHFTLPGSVQGFMATVSSLQPGLAKLEQGLDRQGRSGLAIHLKGLSKAEPVEVLTDTFTPPDVLKMRSYELMATPLVYPGQIVTAKLRSSTDKGAVKAGLRLKVYNEEDALDTINGPTVLVTTGQEQVITWVIPDMDGQPIQKLGIVLHAIEGRVDGTVWLDSLSWKGVPRLTLGAPSKSSLVMNPDQGATASPKPKGDFWRRAWVQSVSIWNKQLPEPFRISQDQGEGIIVHGNREWINYKVECFGFTISLGSSSGLIARVQGLNRYYALLFMPNNQVALTKVRDHERVELAKASFNWDFEKHYNIRIVVDGIKIIGAIEGGPVLETFDQTYQNGGIGMVVSEGSVCAKKFVIGDLN